MGRAGWRAGRWWPLAALLLVALTVLRLEYVLSHLVLVDGPHESGTGLSTFGDLRDALWLPVRDLMAGHNPYDAPSYLLRHPYAAEFDLYAPAHLVLFLPVALLPWPVAAVVWFWLLMVGVLALALVAQLAAGLPRRVDLLLALTAAFLLMRTVEMAVTTGNPSLLVLPAAAWALWRRDDSVAVLIAVAVCWLKPQFGIPVAVLLLVAGAWRPVAKGTALAALVSLPAVVWASVNVGGVGEFLAAVPRNLRAAADSPYTGTTRPGGVRPDLAGFLGNLWGREPDALAVVLALVVVLGLTAWAYRRVLAAEGQAPLAYALASTATVLCLAHGRYDLALCLPVVVVLLTRFARRRLPPGPGRRTELLLAGVTVALVVALLRHRVLDQVLGLSATTVFRVNAAALLMAWLLALAAAATVRRPAVEGAAASSSSSSSPSS